ncbi:hypothetical protein PFISCL1PPCAC_18879, partial [Pristionchus fissidentatus]
FFIASSYQTVYKVFPLVITHCILILCEHVATVGSSLLASFSPFSRNFGDALEDSPSNSAPTEIGFSNSSSSLVILNSLKTKIKEATDQMPFTCDNNGCDDVMVNITIFSHQLISMAESDGETTSMVQFAYQYIHPYIQWDPLSYNGIDSVVVDNDSLWMPNINACNFASEEIENGDDNGELKVFCNGTVSAITTRITTQFCAFD